MLDKDHNQLLQLCATRTVRYNTVIRATRLGPFLLMYWPDGDPIGKPFLIGSIGKLRMILLP